MEQKRRKEMEKEARELARRGEEEEQRGVAWRDELDSDQEEEERERERKREKEPRSRREERERERDRDRGHGHSEVDSSKQKHIRSYRTSRSKSPSRVSVHKAVQMSSVLYFPCNHSVEVACASIHLSVT